VQANTRSADGVFKSALFDHEMPTDNLIKAGESIIICLIAPRGLC
jgi:hypothetical protein